MSDIFQFRWGIPEWDAGYTVIPNPVLERYASVPWRDRDGVSGKGITNQEMMFILHLASYKWEAEGSKANPSLLTLARRMGYKERRSAFHLKDSLIHKNLLRVTEASGMSHTYDLLLFSTAILHMS